MATVGSFGNVVFEVSSETVRTFETFTRRTSANFARHETVNGKPSLEYTGPSLDEIEITLSFNAQLGINPEEEDQRLRDMSHSGEAHAVILGDKNYGNYVVEEVDADCQFFIRGGFRVIETNASLVEYDEPATGPGADAVARNNEARRIPAALQTGLK